MLARFWKRFITSLHLQRAPILDPAEREEIERRKLLERIYKRL